MNKNLLGGFFFFFSELEWIAVIAERVSMYLFSECLLVTTGEVCLSNYYFCIILLHQIFVQINASLLHFTTDLCV